MTSSLHQWESDPLFSAAEVVQDSADRMESLFRLLLHDQNLVQDNYTDPRLLTSIEYHKRDLATIFETAKWQLEDFERAVNLSAMQDKTPGREDVILRHRQFIRAIREQINHVKSFLDSPSMRGSMKNSQRVSLNKQDRDGLAMFLIGGNATDSSNSSILKGFLDSASGLKDDKLVEHRNTKFEELRVNVNFSSKEDHLGLGPGVNPVSCDENGGGNWDLEANEAVPKIIFQESRAKGLYRKISLFGSGSNLWTLWGSKVSKSYIKRLKDGDEQRLSPKYIDASHPGQGQFMGNTSGSHLRIFEGCHILVNQKSKQIVSVVILALLFLGIIVSRLA